MIQCADAPLAHAPLLTVAGRHVVPLTEADAPIVQRLFDRAADYFMLVEGRPAGPDAAMEQLTRGPAGHGPDDLVNLGVADRDGGLAGLVGLVRDHRAPGQWYLGLMLLDPAWRGYGYGSTVYWSIQHWLESQGARSILLAAVERNHRAHRFWLSLGFGNPRPYPPRRIGLKEHVLVEYEKTLRPS